MKALLITFVVVGALVFALVKFGGVMDFDPAKQAGEFRALATPGTDWSVLVDKAKPQEIMTYHADKELGGLELGMAMKYRPDVFEPQIAEGKYTDGFVLRWVFGAGDVYDLAFDGDGKLTGASEPITTKDLLDGSAVEKMKDM